MPRWARLDNAERRGQAACCFALLLLLSFAIASPADARIDNSKNPDNPTNMANPWTEDMAREVGIIEKVNSPVPTGLTLIDEQGEPIELDSLFKEGRPVVFNLGYSRCPSICIAMRSELTKNLGETGLELGEDFIILNVSIDPEETPKQSLGMQKQVVAQLKEKGVEVDPAGWRFLTADAETIKALTDGLGYRYMYIKPQNEYGHPGVLVLADGSGVIRRYLSGTAYSARTLRLSIVETSEGKVGSLLDRAFVTCFVWDPEANNYAATAKFIMMTGGGVIMLFIGGLIAAGFAYEKRRRKLLEEQDDDNGRDGLGGALPAN